ncbi:MAG: nickel uptake transporter family protein [Colwellia sp.]|nr:nickel uptake transporter family protein [Colwellia sp.]
MSLAHIKTTLFTTLLAIASLQVNAHEVWLERDDNGPVRVYLGEPGQPDSGDKINKLAGSQVFTTDREVIAPLNQADDHWQAQVNSDGDVRLFSNSVWQPWSIDETPWWQFWKSTDEKLQGAILQARAGRSETTAKLSYELVPVSENGNTFTALFNGEPQANKVVILLSPSKKEIELTTDVKGQVTLDIAEQGRFLLSSVHTIDTDAMHSGKQVVSLMYITSLTFVAP